MVAGWIPEQFMSEIDSLKILVYGVDFANGFYYDIFFQSLSNY